MKSKRRLLLLLVVGVVYAVGVSAVNIPNVRNCQPKNEYLQPGYVGNYGYNVSVIGGAVGSTPQTIGFTADCSFTVKSYKKCYHTLQVLECEISEVKPPTGSGGLLPSTKEALDSRTFTSLMKKHRVIFSLANGNVENVIAHVEEPLAVLNIKRGIISSLMSVRRSADQTQMRTDVQGTCPVSYVHAEASDSIIHMTKDMNGCHFPGKFDWNYSPFSMFWNMSFIQTFYINSTAGCTFEFKADGESLLKTECRERHAIGLDSTANTAIAVQTNVQSRTYLVSAAVKHGDKSLPSTSNHLLKKIEYEYERSTTVPTPSTSSNYSSQVKDALMSLMAESDGPIQPEIVDHFIKLVALLRTASDLNPIVTELIACDSLALTCTPSMKRNLAKLLADALVHCNSVPCVRAFRHMVEEPDSTLGDIHLNFVLYSWTNIQITDPDFFQEILAICAARKMRLCPLVLSSTIHTFWMRNRDAYIRQDLPTSIANSLDYVFSLIGDKCENDHSDVLTGLKALGNMGSVAEKYNPEVTKLVYKCVLNDRASWAIKMAAIQATRRFDPSTYLYERLLKVLRNSTSDLELRIQSYKILCHHWASSPETLSDLTRFLHSDAADFQLRNYVISHLKSVVTRRNPSSTNFARAIRRAMEADPKLQHLVAVTAFPSNRKSLHTEHFYYHETPILRKILNRFGLRLGIDTLHVDDSFLPFSGAYNFTVRLFGTQVNLLDVITTTRGSENIVMSLADLFSKRKSPVDGQEIVAAIFQLLQRRPALKIPSNDAPIKYGYKVDENFKQNLDRIRRTFAKKFDRAKAATLMYAIQMFGDELFFTTDDLMKRTFAELNAVASKGLFTGPGHHTSGVTQIIEAFNLIPLVTGTPLNWTTESFLVHAGHVALGFSRANGQFTVSLPTEFSGAAVLINKMIVDLPGFTYGGIQSYSTASTSFDAKIAATFGGSNEVKLEMEPPKRRVRLLRLGRKNYIFSGPTKTELPDYDVDRHNASWCLDAPTVVIGVRVCHSRSYPNVTHRADKPWCLMAGTSHWELTADFPNREMKVYELAVKNEASKRDGGGTDTILELSGSGDKSKRRMMYVHTANWSSGEHESQFLIPEMRLEAKMARRRRTDSAIKGFSTRAYVAFNSHEIHSLEYTSGEREVRRSAGRKKSAAAVSSRIHIEENYLNVTIRPSPTITNSYSFNRTRSTNPLSKTTDYHFAYSGIQPSNPNDRLIGDILWENPNSAWFDLREHSTVDHVGYYHLKTPNSIIQVDTFSARQRFDWNLTKTMLPSRELKAFLNMSFVSNSHEDVNGLQERSQSARLATPSQSVSMRGVRRWNKVDSNYSLVLSLDQNKIAMKGYDTSAPEVARRLRAHSHSIELFSHVRNGTSEVIANMPQSTSNRPAHRSNADWSVTLPGQAPITLQASYYEDPLKTHQLNFSFVNPSSNVRLETTNTLTREQPLKRAARVWFNHTSVALMAPFDDTSKITQTLDASFVGGKVIVVHSIDSVVLKSTSNFDWNLRAPQYSDFRLNVSIDSPVWDLLKLDLKQFVFFGGEKMTIRHGLIDIDLQSDWKAGFKRKITFTSKVPEVLPNMVWRMDVTNPFEGGAVLHVHFVDAPALDMYVIARLAADMNELQFTFCRREKCRYIDSDPTTFVAQWTYTLDDPTHLAETIVTNPAVIAELSAIWLPQLSKMFETVMMAMSNPDHPLNRLLKPLLKVPIAQWIVFKMTSATSILYKVGHHVLVSILDFGYIYNPCIQMVARIYNYVSTELHRTYSQPTFVPNFVPWFWSYFDLKSVLTTWTRDTLLEVWKRRTVVPGPVSESSHVTTYTLPIHFDSFTGRARLNAAYLREAKAALAGNEASDLRDVFRPDGPSMYDRYALIWNSAHSQHLKTFDGHFVDLETDDNGDRCSSHLLLHNVVSGDVAVATESGGRDLVFLFPQMRVLLRSNGKIYLNGSDDVTDAPIRSSDGYVNVTRTEGVVSVDTFHHVNAKCIVDESYCLIGTTPWTHNRLIGLLGNNNLNPTDDEQLEESQFRLSSQTTCNDKEAEEEKHHRQDCRNGVFKCDSAFNFLSAATRYSHDVVDPKAFADRCRRQRERADNDNDNNDACDEKSDCSTVRSYLALCAAHGLPVDSIPECSFCVGGHRLGESWQTVVQTHVDIVFVADQWQRPSASASFRKGLELLVETIYRTFIGNGYDDENVRFGLVDFRSDGMAAVEQHSINGKLLSSVDEFVRFALKKPEFASSSREATNMSSGDPTIAFDALETACERFPLNPDAVRILVLLTSDDPPEALNSERLRQVLEALEAEATTLYVLSNYPSVAKGTKIYGVRGDGKIFPQSKGKSEQFTDYPKGQYSKLVSASRGALFLRSFLELPADSKGPFHRYVNAVASEMLARAKQHVGLCRLCQCERTNRRRPFNYAPKIKFQQFKCSR